MLYSVSFCIRGLHTVCYLFLGTSEAMTGNVIFTSYREVLNPVLRTQIIAETPLASVSQPHIGYQNLFRYHLIAHAIQEPSYVLSAAPRLCARISFEGVHHLGLDSPCSPPRSDDSVIEHVLEGEQEGGRQDALADLRPNAWWYLIVRNEMKQNHEEKEE